MSYTRLAPRGLFAALLLLGLLTGCGGGGSSTPVNTGPVTSAPRTVNNLQFTLTADKSVYKVGETVNFTFVVKNIGTQPISLKTYVPGASDATVSHNNQVIWQASILPPGIGTGQSIGTNNTTLAPDAVIAFPFTWDQTTSIPSKVGTQKYTLNAWFTPVSLNGTDVDLATAKTNFAANPLQITVD